MRTNAARSEQSSGLQKELRSGALGNDRHSMNNRLGELGLKALAAVLVAAGLIYFVICGALALVAHAAEYRLQHA